MIPSISESITGISNSKIDSPSAIMNPYSLDMILDSPDLKIADDCKEDKPFKSAALDSTPLPKVSSLPSRRSSLLALKWNNPLNTLMVISMGLICCLP